jgi:hypothetical protein
MTRSPRPHAALRIASFLIFIIIISRPLGKHSRVQARQQADDPASTPTSLSTHTPSATSTPSVAHLTSTASATAAGTTPPPAETASPDPTSSQTTTATEAASASDTYTPSASPTKSPAASPTPSPAHSLTPGPTPPPTAHSAPSGSVLINEIAWAGSFASAHDEWIELHNPSEDIVRIDGWLLTDDNDLQIVLQGQIAPYSFYLLERTDDTTIADIAADMLYTGSLHNSGEQLRLLDPAGGLVDSANLDGGSWPAGDSSSRASMERVGGEDRSGNWRTFTGYGGNGHDAAGGPIQGSPRQPNSIFLPTPTTLTSPTPSNTPTAVPVAVERGAVHINEIAWAGTIASASDEWLELFNTTGSSLDLDGWILTDGNDLRVVLDGTVAAGGFFLLERTDDSVIPNITADQIYTGSLSNSGEVMSLYDAAGNLIDQANPAAGAWPAGAASSRSSMERHGGGWGTFTGYHGSGSDALGRPIQGTPRAANSLLFPTPQPTWIPGKLVINEVLIRPHYDWQGTGGVDTGDEFIEVLNLGPGPVSLRGMILDDIEGAGSTPYELPAVTLKPGSYRAFFRSRTHLALNDGGDVVRLLAADGRLLDEISYLRVRAYNLSYGRFPDGSGRLRYGLWPTPGQANIPFDESPPPSTPPGRCGEPGPSRLPRIQRIPGMSSRLRRMGFGACTLPPEESVGQGQGRQDAGTG